MECKSCFSRPVRKKGVYWCQESIDKFDARVSKYRCVKALFWPNTKYEGVRDVYIMNDGPNGLLGNTDGYDDWGHYLTYSPGVHNGKTYDYLDTGS